MTYKNEVYMISGLGRFPLSPAGQHAIRHSMYAMTRRRLAMLGVFVLGFGGAAMTGACGSSQPGPPAPGVDPPDPPIDCSVPIDEQCMRYHIQLVGNPSMDVALRNTYFAAFGTACYMSEVTTFDCFYKKWETACADAVKIGEVSGNAPYDKGYTCQPVGNGDYTLQVGSDVANKITINYQHAPRQTALTEINGTPTEVNGPYRDLPEPKPSNRGSPSSAPPSTTTAPPSRSGSGSSRSTAKRTPAKFTPISRASRDLVTRMAFQRYVPSRTSSKIRWTPSERARRCITSCP